MRTKEVELEVDFSYVDEHGRVCLRTDDPDAFVEAQKIKCILTMQLEEKKALINETEVEQFFNLICNTSTITENHTEYIKAKFKEKFLHD